MQITPDKFAQAFEDEVMRSFATSLRSATPDQQFVALANMVKRYNAKIGPPPSKRTTNQRANKLLFSIEFCRAAS